MDAIDSRILDSAQHVFDVMAPRVTEDDLERLKDAFAFAAAAHSGQTRKSGEPYIVHPVAVATIAAEELQLSANTVIAAFLHDVVEDTPYTVNDIRERFGDDVAFLVDVLTKRKKEKYENTQQVDNFKQILDSVHYDIRALLVKLSDRLHNMRTLDSMRPDKQMKIAGETDFFYAPLAGRLGLYHVKSELENLSFRYRCPREFETLERQLAEDRKRTEEPLRRFLTEIDDILSAEGLSVRTEVRYRRPYSVWRDMKEAGCDFAHVEFKHFVRVIYSPMEEWITRETIEKDTALFIYSLLSRRFKERPGSIINYIDNPKDNGYQGFHVRMLSPSGEWEELHISSERMHLNARLGCVVETGEGWLERFRGILKDIVDNNDGYFFMEGVSSTLYNENIIAFTPKGKGIILPKGASALDFAYEVHTHIGDHAQYARINGRLCSIKTKLHRGDCVEIGINESVHPRSQWLTYAKAYKTRNCIHDYLKKQPRSEYILCPICHPLPGDEVIGFKEPNGRISLHTRHCPEAIKRASEDGDSIQASVSLKYDSELTYPVTIKVTAVDRPGLMKDIIECIGKFGLSIDRLEGVSEEQLMTCTMSYSVHSSDEFRITLTSIGAIDSVDEVQQVEE